MKQNDDSNNSNKNERAFTNAHQTLDQLVTTPHTHSRLRRFISRPFIITYFALAALALPQKCDPPPKFLPISTLIDYPKTFEAIETEESTESKEFSSQINSFSRTIPSSIKTELEKAAEDNDLPKDILPTLYLLSKPENNSYHNEKHRQGYGGIILISEAEAGILQSTLDRDNKTTIDQAAKRVKELYLYLEQIPEKEKLPVLIAMYFTDENTIKIALQKSKTCADRLASAFVNNPYGTSQLQSRQKPIPKMTLSGGSSLYDPSEGDILYSSLNTETVSAIYDEIVAEWNASDKMPKSLIAGPFVPYHYDRQNCMRIGHGEYNSVNLSLAERGIDTTAAMELGEKADTYCFASIIKYLHVKRRVEGENNFSIIITEKVAQANRFTKEDFLTQVKEDRECLWYGSQLDNFTRLALLEYHYIK